MTDKRERTTRNQAKRAARNIASQRRESPGRQGTGMIEVQKHPDGTVTTSVWPSAGVVAVARLLRQQYLSEHETDAPVSDWYSQAMDIVRVYLEAEDIA